MLLKWFFLPVAGFLLVSFFACLTLLVFEFVVSPTHDYTTFSDYGLDVCINYLLFAFLINITSLCSKVQRPCTTSVELNKVRYYMHNVSCNNALRLVAASLFTTFISTCTMINFKLIVSKTENKF